MTEAVFLVQTRLSDPLDVSDEAFRAEIAVSDRVLVFAIPCKTESDGRDILRRFLNSRRIVVTAG